MSQWKAPCVISNYILFKVYCLENITFQFHNHVLLPNIYTVLTGCLHKDTEYLTGTYVALTGEVLSVWKGKGKKMRAKFV